jgi:hypothetical protein
MEPANHTDVATLTGKLVADGIVYGERLETADTNNNGTRHIRRRTPYALTVKGIAAITPIDFKIVASR